MKTCCVYGLFLNGQLVYIGSTESLTRREKEHRYRPLCLWDECRPLEAHHQRLKAHAREMVLIALHKPPVNMERRAIGAGAAQAKFDSTQIQRPRRFKRPSFNRAFAC